MLWKIGRRVAIGGVLLMLCSLTQAGCAGTGNEKQTDSFDAEIGAFKVAMVIPGEIDDNAWGQVGYEGLESIKSELGAEVAYNTHVPFDPNVDVEGMFRRYAQEGFDLIIGHGDGYRDDLETVAEEFPRTKFMLVGRYGRNNKNLGAVSLRSGEMGYLTGVVAAVKTKTNKVAFIGAEENALLHEQATQFERGAKAINPEVEVFIEWTGSWTDKAKVREIARASIDSGADVVMGLADQASFGVVEVAKEAEVHAIGVYWDQHQLAPDTILTSMTLDIPKAILEGALLVQKGHFEGRQYKFGLREDVHDLAPFYGSLTPAQEEVVNDARNDILRGEIDVSL